MWPLLLAAFLFFLVPAFSIFPGIWGFDDMGRRGANYRKPPHNAITIDLLHFNNSSGDVEIRDWWLKRQTDGRTDGRISCSHSYRIQPQQEPHSVITQRATIKSKICCKCCFCCFMCEYLRPTHPAHWREMSQIHPQVYFLSFTATFL